MPEVNGINQFDIHANWFFVLQKSAKDPLVAGELSFKYL